LKRPRPLPHLINFDQVAAAATPHTARIANRDAGGVNVSTTSPAAPPTLPTGVVVPEENGVPHNTRFIESIFDNLSFWTVVSAAIGFLYLIWATLEILSRYVGHVPSVTP
jgi:hypothetical protein